MRQSFFLLILFTALIGWGATYAINWPGFRPHGVGVSGARVVAADDIRRIAHIEATDNIWLVNPWAIARNIEAIPYIATAHVHRTLPNIVRIEVTERQPESCVQVPRQRIMTIDATQRVLEYGCKAPLRYDLAQLTEVKPGATLDDASLVRLRAVSAQLAAQGVLLRASSFDRDGGVVVDRNDGLKLLLGDDPDMSAKAKLIAPILRAARAGGHTVVQIDLRDIDTPVVRYRESNHPVQNGRAK